MKNEYYCEEQINSLQHYFSNVPCPKGPVEIKGYAVINDPSYFITSNLALATRFVGTHFVKSCMKRLNLMKQCMEEHSKIKEC